MVPEWAIGVALVCVVFFGSVRMLVRAGESGKRKRLSDEGSERLAALDERVEALEQAQHRIAELEERVDFAERLLARQSEAERLAPPRH